MGWDLDLLFGFSYLRLRDVDVTPLMKVDCFCNGNTLFIKKDDFLFSLGGGSKIRKLEFILGDIISKGYRRIYTIGGTGSNFVLALYLLSNRLNVSFVPILISQPLSRLVFRNLRFFMATGANVVFSSRLGSISRILKVLFDRNSFFIFPGGSSPVGSMGFVYGAYELYEQTKGFSDPKIDIIFIPAGSLGSILGLRAGLDLLGLNKIEIMGVYVADRLFFNNFYISYISNGIEKLIRRNFDETFRFSNSNLLFDTSFSVYGYGSLLNEVLNIIDAVYKKCKVKLDPVYTGKTFLSLVKYCKSVRGKNILFWNTFGDFSLEAAGIEPASCRGA